MRETGSRRGEEEREGGNGLNGRGSRQQSKSQLHWEEAGLVETVGSSRTHSSISPKIQIGVFN